MSAPDSATVSALVPSFGKVCISVFLGICQAVGLLGYGFITHFEDPQPKLFYSSLRINHGRSFSILNNERESLQMLLVLLSQ